MKKILIFSISMIWSYCFCQLDSNSQMIKISSQATYIDPITLQAIQSTQSYDTTSRRIYFIHGLGGTAASWQKASDACWDNSLNIPNFPARKVEVQRVEYTHSTMSTLSSAAYDVKNQLELTMVADITAHSLNPQRAFIIAHSQGGLVTRSLVHNYMTGNFSITNLGMPFGGFVTVASPLQGARILNNRDLILDMAEDACQSLISGPLSNTPFELIIDALGYNFDDDACNLVSSEILPMFFQDYYDNITNEYTVGAPAITTFNNDVNYSAYLNMPKLAIYGVEPRTNIFWRTANYFINDPNSSNHFQANNDWKFYNETVLPLYFDYYANYTTFLNESELYHILGLSCGILQLYQYGIAFELLSFYNYNRAMSYYRGVQWFSRVNESWETVIGARAYENQYVGTWYRCKRCIVNPVTLWPFQQDCVNWNCKEIIPVPLYQVNLVLKQSDGVALAESAQNLPGATCIPPRITITGVPQYDGSSHMQIRNDEYLKRSLKKLFDGEYGWFFETPIKSN